VVVEGCFVFWFLSCDKKLWFGVLCMVVFWGFDVEKCRRIGDLMGSVLFFGLFGVCFGGILGF
jgi:hypothetical protein